MRVRFPAVLLLLGACAACLAESFAGKVVGISDGDTISVMKEGKAAKVRLWGIDTPEAKQAFGTKAKQFTSDLVFSKIVTVEIKDTDRYGRLVGVVTFDAKDEKGLDVKKELNLELVKAGMAWWYKQYARYAEKLMEAEEEARKGRKGLWADPNPVPPWQFRNGGALTLLYDSYKMAA